MSLFVTGTDTGVGKTIVSALLLARYASELELAYWKPVATGAGGVAPERDSVTVAGLVPEAVEIRLEVHLLGDPVSPHLAARREGVEIDLDLLARTWKEWQEVSPERGVVVEGAGGLMVPLNERRRVSGSLPWGSGRSAGGELMIDLMALLELPVLVVARSTLGTINHTLLSLDTLRRRGLTVAGVVLVGPPDEENRRAIENYGEVEVVAEVPPLEISARGIEAAAAGFDLAGALRPRLSYA